MKYKYNEVIKFKFKPNSSNILGDEVELVGVVSGIRPEEKLYFVQLRDNEREIYGSIQIPEKHIVLLDRKQLAIEY